ncbi:hypothetical protein JHK87_043623 [Glycine soja]|nr:hypothetical protein JHK87_043623 [Glycine soja]
MSFISHFSPFVSHSLYSRVFAELGFRASNICHSTIHHQQPSPRLLLLFIVLPLTLATLAFVLQWRNNITSLITRWSPDDNQFPDMATATATPSLCHHSDCDNNPLFQSHNPSFPYFHDWTFDFSSNLPSKANVMDTLSRLSHDTDSEVAMATVISMDLIGVDCPRSCTFGKGLINP